MIIALMANENANEKPWQANDILMKQAGKVMKMLMKSPGKLMIL